MQPRSLKVRIDRRRHDLHHAHQGVVMFLGVVPLRLPEAQSEGVHGGLGGAVDGHVELHVGGVDESGAWHVVDGLRRMGDKGG